MDVQAIDLIRKFTKKAPTDMEGLASHLGLEIKQDDDLGDNAGKIVKRNNGKYEIMINSSESRYRQRFTLAHEIAHFILHKKQIGDGITDNALFRSGLSNRTETQANRLAAQMLMPARLMRKEWRDGKRGAKTFSKIFDVSPQAADIRLDWLGLTVPDDDWD